MNNFVLRTDLSHERFKEWQAVCRDLNVASMQQRSPDYMPLFDSGCFASRDELARRLKAAQLRIDALHLTFYHEAGHDD